MKILLKPSQVFLTGPRFKGLKMLPPGPHFFFTNASSRMGDFAPTCGFFLWVDPQQVRAQGSRNQLLDRSRIARFNSSLAGPRKALEQRARDAARARRRGRGAALRPGCSQVRALHSLSPVQSTL